LTAVDVVELAPVQALLPLYAINVMLPPEHVVRMEDPDPDATHPVGTVELEAGVPVQSVVLYVVAVTVPADAEHRHRPRHSSEMRFSTNGRMRSEQYTSSTSDRERQNTDGQQQKNGGSRSHG
jgi:hypothetical protein